ncbi:MAG: ABC transporter substrate-binding protein [Ktedonobacterales bacterium]|nr:ABC transporter substrate-binding protein [Ktedonobacterales bacterium]
MDVRFSLRWSMGFLLGLACILSGCARLHALAGNATATPPTWALGLVGAGLGPGGVEGSYSGNGAQLAIEQVNAHGGILWHGTRYQLATVFSGASAVSDRVRELLGHDPPIVALLGPDENDAAVAAMPLLASAGLPTLTLAMASELTAPPQNGGTPTILRLRPALTTWAAALANYAVQSGGTFVLASEDDPYGHAGAAALAAAGPHPAAQVNVPPGMIDATASVSAILALHASTVLCWGAEAEAATLLHALHGAGWAGQFLVGAVDATFIALAGRDAAGVVGGITWSPDLTDTASRQFTAAYVQRFGALPDEHAAALYDAVNLLSATLAQVGPDHAALLAALLALPSTAGVAGTYRGTASGDLLAAPHLVNVQGTTVRLLGS